MKRWLPSILIVALLVAFRVVGGMYSAALPNFQPLTALLLCGLVFLNGAQRWVVPVGAWLVSYPLASLAQGYPIMGWDLFAVVLGVLPVLALAPWARRRPGLPALVTSAAVSAVLFYFLTNLISFAVDPLYPKTAEGFLQAQWTGPVGGLLPTWIFLRNLLAANLLFTALFVLSRQSILKTSPAPAGALAR